MRYLSCVISRFTRVASRDVVDPGRRDRGASRAADPDRRQANPRQVSRGRALVDRAASILEFYGSLIGEAPYPSFTLALTENDLPGGHSPGYFAILNQPLPLSPLVWRNDPVAFDGYQPYFLAHEIAHQWWGQGVGWKNYHEQWLSEGFAQYFAALYAATRPRRRGVPATCCARCGAGRSNNRIKARCISATGSGTSKAKAGCSARWSTTKGAMVLHMLRRLVGDDKFFAGLRQFYGAWKFRKAGTDDFRRAMEKASGQDLDGFFEGWIYGFGGAEIGFTSTLTPGEARIRFEHRRSGDPHPGDGFDSLCGRVSSKRWSSW